LKKEISPAATYGIIALVVVVLGAVGYFAFFRSTGSKLSPEEQQKAEETVKQQYQQPGRTGGPPPGMRPGPMSGGGTPGMMRMPMRR
jgi:hypothetical protein